MASSSISDSGNETRGSSESDNSPTPTKDIITTILTNGSRGTSIAAAPVPSRSNAAKSRSHPPPAPASSPPRSSPAVPTIAVTAAVPLHRNSASGGGGTQINTRTTPVSRTTPTTRPHPPPQQQQTQQHSTYNKLALPSHRLTPTAQARGPLRPLQRRPPGSGMGSAGSVHAVAPLGPLGPLNSSRGRQRNSVAVVDSREHIYEELEMCRGPPKIAPVSGVLQQGKVVIRPIAFKPVLPNGMSQSTVGSKGLQGGQDGTIPASENGFAAIQGRPDPRYTSTPTLSRGQIQHYGSMGDLKSLGHSSSYSLDRRGVGVGVGPPNPPRSYCDPYLENNYGTNNSSSKICVNVSNSSSNNNNNNNNNKNTLSKYSNCTKINNAKNLNLHGKAASQTTMSDSPSSHNSSGSSHPTSPASSKGSPNSNSSDGSSPSSYPGVVPPPRPPSHQSTCSNVDEGGGGGGGQTLPQHHLHHHHRFPSFDNRLSSTYDPMMIMAPFDHNPPPTPPPSNFSPPHKYHSGNSSGGGSSGGTPGSSDLPRYESLRNLSSAESHGHISHPRLHHRMGGSVSNLTRLGHHHHHHHLHHHSSSITGSNLGLDRSLSVTGSNLALDRSVSGGGGSIRGSLSELRLDDHHQTPSPSDSGVAELEAMLKEKDSEINTLRETMEQNEQVIFKVYEEKEKTWERELKKIRDLYDSRLKAAQQKALKVEQSLSTQTYQLQQERRKVSAELEEAKRERDTGNKQVEQLKKEVGSLRAQLEETEWGLCQKSGEISLLKTQLKDSQGDQTTRGHELLHLRAQIRQYQQEVERRRAELTSMHDLTAQLRREAADLRSQVEQAQMNQTQDQDMAQVVEKTRLEVEKQKKMFEEERNRWVEEKERVICYQKQLHHNYVSMLSRNRQLEEEVARLTGVPLPPTTTHSGSCMIPPAIPSFSSTCLSSLPNLPPNYSDSLAVNGESRC